MATCNPALAHTFADPHQQWVQPHSHHQQPSGEPFALSSYTTGSSCISTRLPPSVCVQVPGAQHSCCWSRLRPWWYLLKPSCIPAIRQCPLSPANPYDSFLHLCTVMISTHIQLSSPDFYRFPAGPDYLRNRLRPEYRHKCQSTCLLPKAFWDQSMPV